MPHASPLLLFATVLFAGLVSLPQDLAVGPVTALGAASALGCCAAWIFWLARPRLARPHVGVLLPLVLFAVYAAGTLLWFAVSVKGLQFLCVLFGFVGLVALTTREVEDDPALADRLHRALDAATWFATAVYALSLLRDGLGTDGIILARPYALFVLLGLARQLALWQSGDSRGLIGAAAILAVILGSVSRTALAAALLLAPLAALLRGDRKGVAFAVGGAVAGALTIAGALTYSDAMYERFFGYDATMQVGGVWINGSGRTAMWSRVWDSAVHAPVLGHGVASSSLLIDEHFPGLGHPHNDYLRFFHDFGLLGLGLWLAFLVTAGATLLARARRAARAGSPDRPHHLVALLGVVAVGITMLTDNTVSYAFVMAPLGVLIGCSLGRSGAPATGGNGKSPPARRLVRHRGRWAPGPRTRQAAAPAQMTAGVPS